MTADLSPEQVLNQLDRGRLSPFYLFYGEGEFQLEKVLGKIRGAIVSEETKEFNLQIFYGDQANPAEILDGACSVPFISEKKLIVVRRTEDFSPQTLERFIPYLEDPVQSTCLIFLCSRPDFRKKFYKKIRELGQAVNFRRLYDDKVVPWIKRMGREMGLVIDGQACAYLHQVVGNRMRDLYSELEKLYLCHGETTIGLKEVRDLVVHSRIYTIFELMDEISGRRGESSLSALKRFLEEGGRDAPQKLVGMLNRQIRLLWQTKWIIEGGGTKAEAGRKLGLQGFQINRLVQQSKRWTHEDLEEAVHSLYEVDARLKSGAETRLVLENLVLSLCAS